MLCSIDKELLRYLFLVLNHSCVALHLWSKIDKTNYEILCVLLYTSSTWYTYSGYNFATNSTISKNELALGEKRKTSS